MVALTLRATKGSPLTHNEVDANFTALNEGLGGEGGILNVRDFGCIGDGVTDDTAAFQSAIDALFNLKRGIAQYGYGSRLRVPYGTYKLTRLSFLQEDFEGSQLILEGDGSTSTVLMFSDPTIGCEFGNCGYFHVSNIQFQGLNKATGQYLVVLGLMNNNSGTGVFLGKFVNCSFGGGQIGVSVQGINGAGMPAPGVGGLPQQVLGCASELYFDNCHFNGSARGFFVAHFNALDFIFVNCGVTFCDYGIYVGHAGGEVTFIGGSHSFCEVSFRTGSSECMTIIGTRIEAGATFLQTAGDGPRVNVIGVKAQTDDLDNQAILHEAGALTLDSSSIAGKIWVNSGAISLVARNCGILDDVAFHAILSEDVSVAAPVYYNIQGCTGFDTAANTVMKLPDETGVLRGGADKIPFTFSQHSIAQAANATVAGDQFHGINGQTLITNLPNADPVFAGQIWNDAGALKVSAGNAWSQLNKAAGIKLASNTALPTALPLMKASYHGAADATGSAAVLGTVGKSTGQWYFEVKLLDNDYESVFGAAVGVALATMDVDGAGFDEGYVGVVGSAGLFSNQDGATTGSVAINAANVFIPTHADIAGLGFVVGDIVQVAVDADADLIWFSLNNTDVWNGGAGTPAAGTGGYSIAAVTGTFYPACSIHKNHGTYNVGNVMRDSLCWQGYFALTQFAPPVGFSSWVPVLGVVPANTVAPTVSPIEVGVGGEDSPVITCTTGTWTGDPTSFLYQWARDGVNIAGANLDTYTAVDADVGTVVTCKVAGVTTSGISAYTESSNDCQPEALPVNTVAPAVTPSGTVGVSVLLTCTTGTWTEAPSSYAYQWMAGGFYVIPGETGNTYTTGTLHIPLGFVLSDITCLVIATNAAGDSSPAESNTVVVEE